jgi:hypothetical protein
MVAVSVSGLVHDAFETVESCLCEEGCIKCEHTVTSHTGIMCRLNDVYRCR